MVGQIVLSGSGGSAKRYWNVTAPNSSNYDIQEQGVTPVVNTYNISVTAANSSNYTLSGTDRSGSVSGSDPTVTVQQGDTINFNMNAGGHPMYIKTVGGTGQG